MVQGRCHGYGVTPGHQPGSALGRSDPRGEKFRQRERKTNTETLPDGFPLPGSQAWKIRQIPRSRARSGTRGTQTDGGGAGREGRREELLIIPINAPNRTLLLVINSSPSLPLIVINNSH